MSGPGDFDHLSGTEVFFDKVSPPETWVLDEKITEQYQTVTQCEVDDGLGPPFAAIKFACYSAADPNKKGIMRIYIQTPINGTSARGPRARAQQAVTQRTYLELKALKSLADQKCKVVPELLGYNEEQQDDEGCVPGGYINHIVWARESLDYKVFWDRDLEYRNEVRPRFRKAYEYVRVSRAYSNIDKRASNVRLATWTYAPEEDHLR